MRVHHFTSEKNSSGMSGWKQMALHQKKTRIVGFLGKVMAIDSEDAKENLKSIT